MHDMAPGPDKFLPAAPTRVLTICTASLLLACGCVTKRESFNAAARNLAGTSWRLVQFDASDGTVLTPDDRSKYTLRFEADGRVFVRFDCNRGSGDWKSPGPNQIELGPLALTRAMCPRGSLHDHLVKQWEHIRTYVVRNGHLFLSLMADGGTYELEPFAADGA
jgi:para-nitrobenzyl esterase